MSSQPSISDIVSGGYCVGCGACTLLGGGEMTLNGYGEYLPSFVASSSQVSLACPFLHPELNEDELASRRYGNGTSTHPAIGKHLSVYAGYVKEGSYRLRGTSGGMGTWVGVELLRQGQIDAVIHVKPVQREHGVGPLFRYEISRTEESVIAGAQSRYQAVELSHVLDEVRQVPGRYLFIGVPCFCKAVRRLQEVDEVFAENIQFVVSLVCGHLKSVNWTLSLAWGAGVHPGELSAFQHRIKAPGISARSYVFRATPKNGESVVKDSSDVVGGKFNAGAMMLNACDYCDDVVGETADLTIGDAWLPEFEADNAGTNLLVVRDERIGGLLASGVRNSAICLQEITAEQAASSQMGGLRHRREGLGYRLAKKEREGKWAPEKRIAANSAGVPRLRRRIYDSRQECAKVSRDAFMEAVQANNFTIYERRTRSLFSRLRQLEIRSTFWRSIRSRVSRAVHRCIRRSRTR